MKISYCIGIHNEPPHYIETLLNQILKYKDPEDEVIVVDDYSDNPETLASIKKYEDRISFNQHALSGDFSQLKNYGTSLATGDWIFCIDGDENVHQNLLLSIKEIILNNPSIELYYIPRINIVNGITPEYIKEQNWIISPEGYINIPDAQGRIYKNDPARIQWKGKVHERIEGHRVHSFLPFQDETGKVIPDYCILHIKDFERQKQQNLLYNKMI